MKSLEAQYEQVRAEAHKELQELANINLNDKKSVRVYYDQWMNDHLQSLEESMVMVAESIIPFKEKLSDSQESILQLQQTEIELQDQIKTKNRDIENKQYTITQQESELLYGKQELEKVKVSVDEYQEQWTNTIDELSTRYAENVPERKEERSELQVRIGEQNETIQKQAQRLAS